MRKFFALIQNEYVKLMASTGTWVMVILTVLAAIAIPGIGAISNSANYSYYHSSDYYDPEFYYQTIKQEESEKYNGWEYRKAYYEFLIDNSIGSEEWRREVSANLFAITLTFGEEDGTEISDAEYKKACENAYGKQTEGIMATVKNNDSLEYCRLALEYNKEAHPDSKDMSISTYNLEYQYRIDNNIPIDNSWKSTLVSEYSNSYYLVQIDLERKRNGESINENEFRQNEIAAAKALYRIENNIEVDLKDDLTWATNFNFSTWTLWSSTTGMSGEATSDAVFSILSIIGVFVAVVAGGIVAGEFSDGTVKFLLINPTKRWKIITAKYFTVISVGFILLLIAFIVSGLASMIFMGIPESSAAYLEVDGSTIKSIPGILYIARRYLIGSVSVIIYGSLAFAISSLMSSAAISVGISLLAMLGGGIINLIMVAASFDWGRFLIFANADINSIIDKNPIYEGQTIGFTLGVIAVHMAVFLLIAWDGFTRKEV